MACLAKRTLTAAILLFLSLGATAQYQLIEIEKPQLSKSVGGLVTDPVGTVVSGVSVEEWTAGWKKFVRATHTDNNGRFYLQPEQGKTIYYLQFQSPGFDPLRLKLKVDPEAKPGITVKMLLAT